MNGSAKAWLLAFVLAAGGGFAALVGVGCAMNANTCPFGDDRPPITATDGEELFATLCTGCHGPQGGGGRGPTLVAGSAARMDLEAIQSRVRRGRPLAGMPPFGKAPYNLSPEQIAAVSRYVLELREE